MYFEEGCTYHVYNRSNEILFRSRENYLFFLRKIRELVLPYAHVLSYCLMPNHFHFILKIKQEGIQCFENERVDQLQYIAKAIGTLQSSYTQALNKQIGRRGNLFAHKVKAKSLTHTDNDYALNCFMYIHQNPKLAELVDKIEDWEFSSFPDFIGKRNGTLINKQIALEVFQLESSQIYGLTCQMLQDKMDEDFL